MISGASKLASLLPRLASLTSLHAASRGSFPTSVSSSYRPYRKPLVDSRHTLDGLHSPSHACPNLHVLWPGGSLQIHVLLNSLSLSGIQPLCPLYIIQTNHTCSHPRHCFPLACSAPSPGGSLRSDIIASERMTQSGTFGRNYPPLLSFSQESHTPRTQVLGESLK